DSDRSQKDDLEARRLRAIELAIDTYDALVAERGDSGKMWASALKDAIRRRRPECNESYYGFRAFGNLLEAAQKRGWLEVGRDEKSGTYVYRHSAQDEGDSESTSPGQTNAKRGEPDSRAAAKRNEPDSQMGGKRNPPASKAAGRPNEIESKAGPGERTPMDSEAQHAPAQPSAATGESPGSASTSPARS